jgi:hypothetical protein
MSNFDHFLSSIEAEKCVAYFHIIFQIKRKTIDMTELFQNQIEKLLKINTPITHIYPTVTSARSCNKVDHLF